MISSSLVLRREYIDHLGPLPWGSKKNMGINVHVNMNDYQLEPHKAVAEVSKIGHL